MRFLLCALVIWSMVGRALSAQSAIAQVRLATPALPKGKEYAAAGVSDPISLTPKADESGKETPARNPYVGAQAGYVFGGGDFASNVIANGSMLYQVLQASTISHGKKLSFFLPVRGNVSSLVAAKDSAGRAKAAQSIVSGAQGLRVAVEPYLALPSVGFLTTGLFASAGWKMNTVKDKNDTTRYLALGRLALGLEAVLGPQDGSKSPIVVDVSPVYSAFAGRDFQSVSGLQKSVWSGEFTVVIPVAASMGFLTEAVVAQRALPVWRLGLIMSATSAPPAAGQ